MIEHESYARHVYRGLGQAVAWLLETHGDAAIGALYQIYLGELPRDTISKVVDMPEELRGMLFNNGYMWLVIAGELEVEDEIFTVVELLEEEDDDSAETLDLGTVHGLDDDQIAWLQLASQCPLGLYEILDVTADGEVRARDLVAASETLTLAPSPLGARFDVGDVVGLRLVPTPDGELLPTPELYAFDHAFLHTLPSLLDALRGEARVEDALPWMVDGVVPGQWARAVFLAAYLASGEEPPEGL